VTDIASGRGGGRLAPVSSAADDPGLARVFDVFRNAGRDVPVLYRTLGNSPAMLDAWTNLAWPLRHDAKTDRGLRELVVMRVAQLTDAPFEWLAHWEMAVKHGVSTEQLTALADWAPSGLFSEEQRDVLAMTDELTRELQVSDATWERLTARFDPGEIVELLLTASFYSCVSRVLRALGLAEDVDQADPRLVALRASG